MPQCYQTCHEKQISNVRISWYFGTVRRGNICLSTLMLYHHASNIQCAMRTTLDIADDVLFAAKEIARRDKKPLGQIISDLARRAFAQSAQGTAQAGEVSAAPHQVSEKLAHYGIHPLPARGRIVSNELIDRLRDEEGI
jgi:hypothetical protein